MTASCSAATLTRHNGENKAGRPVKPMSTFSTSGTTPRQPVLIIAGPEGVPIAPVALSVARTLGGDLIAASSTQVYKDAVAYGGKPDQLMRSEVPVHLVDLVNLDEIFTVGRFLGMSRTLIDDCGAGDRVPVLTGCGAHYLQMLVGGAVRHPDPGDAYITHARALCSSGNWEACMARLEQLDPAAAARLPAAESAARDWPRMTQALARALQAAGPVDAALKQRKDYALDFCTVVLDLPHEMRYSRLARQAHSSMEAGLVEETLRLIPRGLEHSPLASRAGYAQALEYLAQQWLTSFPRSPQSRRRGLGLMVERHFRALRRQSDRQWRLFRRHFQGAAYVPAQGRDAEDVAAIILQIWREFLAAQQQRRGSSGAVIASRSSISSSSNSSIGAEEEDGSGRHSCDDSDVTLHPTFPQPTMSSPTLTAHGAEAFEYLRDVALDPNTLVDREATLHSHMINEGVVSAPDPPRQKRVRREIGVVGPSGRLTKGQKRARRWREKNAASESDIW